VKLRGCLAACKGLAWLRGSPGQPNPGYLYQFHPRLAGCIRTFGPVKLWLVACISSWAAQPRWPYHSPHHYSLFFLLSPHLHLGEVRQGSFVAGRVGGLRRGGRRRLCNRASPPAAWAGSTAEAAAGRLRGLHRGLPCEQALKKAEAAWLEPSGRRGELGQLAGGAAPPCSAVRVVAFIAGNWLDPRRLAGTHNSAPSSSLPPIHSLLSRCAVSQWRHCWPRGQAPSGILPHAASLPSPSPPPMISLSSLRANPGAPSPDGPFLRRREGRGDKGATRTAAVDAHRRWDDSPRLA
jgi:hypothetical protein